MFLALLLASALAAEVPVLVDDATGLTWAAAPSPDGLAWEAAGAWCVALGDGWRLPTRGELETLVEDGRLRPTFAAPGEGVLFSGEEVPRALDPTTRHPWAMNPANGHVFNGAGRTGAARCVRGAPTRQQAAVAVPEGWWSAPDACPEGAHLAGVPGSAVWCKDAEGRSHGRRTRWLGERRTEGRYVHGAQEGAFLTRTADGTLVLEESYVAGALHGVRTEYDDQGRVRTVSRFDRGRLLDAVEVDVDGRPLQGLQVSRHPDGRPKSASTFRNGRRQGLSLTWSANGQLVSAGVYRRGLPHGVVQRWFDDGRPMMAVTWRRGERRGPTVHWQWDGRVEVSWREGSEVVRKDVHPSGTPLPRAIATMATPPRVPRRLVAPVPASGGAPPSGGATAAGAAAGDAPTE